jgi:ribosome recycling factor
MSFEDVIADAKSKLDKALQSLAGEFRRIRTGRANPAMIEHVHVEAYGSSMPITQCAGITVPEPSQLMIKPWDKGLLRAIEKALVDAELNMSPNNDGSVIRLNIPPLSTERRKQLAGQAKEACEKCKVSMRNVRRDAIKHVETKGKETKQPEDQIKKATEKISEMLKQSEAKADSELKSKTDDIMTL